jgi:hypothetical protein
MYPKTKIKQGKLDANIYIYILYIYGTFILSKANIFIPRKNHCKVGLRKLVVVLNT